MRDRWQSSGGVLVGSGLARKKVIRLLLASFLLVVLWPLRAVAEEPKPIKHVVLISIDGLSYEGYANYSKSNIKYLAIEGVSAPKCLALRADTVEAGEATLLTGSLPTEHQYYTSHDRVEAESLLDIFAKEKRGVLVVDGSGGKLKGFARGEKEYLKVAADVTDAEVMNRAMSAFKKYKPFFTYIYLNDCKEARLNPARKAYWDAIKLSDNEVGRLVAMLKETGIYDHTVLVVTAARASTASDLVPVVIKAPQLKPYTAVEGVTVFDIAPTICSLVGVSEPYSANGLTIWDAFQARDQKEEINLMERHIRGLEQERLQSWLRYYQLDRERLRLLRQIQEIKDERERIFGYAGEREHTIGSLRESLFRTRAGALILTGILLLGYYVEYRLLKKRFTLFH